MAVTLGTLLVKLEAHTSGFSKGMKDMRNLSFSSARDISNSLGSIGRALKGLDFSTPAGSAKAFGVIGTVVGAGIGAIATAAVAAGAATAKMAVESAQAADKLNNLAQSTGVSVEFLSRLQYAAKLADTDVTVLAKGVQKMERAMFEAATGGKEAAEGFNVLGVAVKNAATGDLRSAEEVFKDVANKLGTMEDGALKTAVAQKIFGRAGADLIPVMNQLGGSINEVFQESDRLGVTLSTKAAQAADRFTDNIEKLKSSMTGFSNRVMSGSIDALEELSKFLLDFVTKSQSAVAVADALSESLKFMASAAVIAASRFADLINSIQTMNRIQANLQFGNFNLKEVNKALDDYNAQLKETARNENRALAAINKKQTPADVFFSNVQSGSSDSKTGKTPSLGGTTGRGLAGEAREANKSLAEGVELLRQYRSDALSVVDPVASIGAKWDENVAKLEALATKVPSLRGEISKVIDLNKQAKLIQVEKEDLELLDAANRSVEEYVKSIESIPQFVAPEIALPELKTDIFGARIQELQERFGEAAKGTEEFGRAQTEAFNAGLTAEQKYALGIEQLNLLLDESVDGQRARTRLEHELSEQRIRDIGEELLATRNFVDGAKAAFMDYAHSAKNAAENAYRAFQSSFQSIEDGLTDLLSGEKVDFSSIESGILKEFNRALVVKPGLGTITAKIGDLFGLDTSALSKPDGTAGNPIHTVMDNFGGLSFDEINQGFSDAALEISTEFGGVIDNTDAGFQGVIANTDSGFSGVVSKIGSALNSVFGGGKSGGSGVEGIISGIAGMFMGGGASTFAFSGGGDALMNSGLGDFTGTGGGWDMLFADGGVTNRPAIFGEAGPEAAVPLPDGRSIPVKLSGGGDTPKVDVHMTFNNADRSVDFRMAGSQAGAAAHAEFMRNYRRNGKG
jgi:lambda family phage tail tape measure protein